MSPRAAGAKKFPTWSCHSSKVRRIRRRCCTSPNVERGMLKMHHRRRHCFSYPLSFPAPAPAPSPPPPLFFFPGDVGVHIRIILAYMSHHSSTQRNTSEYDAGALENKNSNRMRATNEGKTDQVALDIPHSPMSGRPTAHHQSVHMQKRPVTRYRLFAPCLLLAWTHEIPLAPILIALKNCKYILLLRHGSDRGRRQSGYLPRANLAHKLCQATGATPALGR